MPHSIKKILTAAVSLACVAAFTFLAVAWFAGFTHHGTVDFKPGANPALPDTMMWMYYSENDGAAAGAEQWVAQNVINDTKANEWLKIPAVQMSTDTTTGSVTYTMSTLHFGKVDNLVTLNNDNKVYFRFFIDKKVLADPSSNEIESVTFTLAYKTAGYTYKDGEPSVLDSFYLYKEVNQEYFLVDLKDALENGRHVLEYQEDNPAAMQFIQMRYVVTTAKYDTPDGADGFLTANIFETAEVHPINCGSAGIKHSVTDANGNTVEEPVCSACASGDCGKIELDLTGANLTDNQIGSGFYVYVELAPLLDAFSMQENILDYFVPAYMLFDVKLDLEIK